MMIDPMLYTLMGFVSGTAFGGWAALSIRASRFGKVLLPEKGHDPTPAQIEALPWKKRAKECETGSGGGSGGYEGFEP
jgi:hypothetical protein